MNTSLFIFFLLLPFQFALSPTEGVDLAIVRVAILGIGAIFLMERLREGSWILPKGKAAFAMSLFLVLSLLSAFWAEEPTWTFRKIIFLLSFLPLFFVLTDVFSRGGAELLRWLGKGFFLGATISAGVALLQFAGQAVFSLEEILRFWTSRIYPVFLGDAFAQSVATHPSLLVNIGGETILRAVGVFPDPHVAAFYFGMAIPFGLWLGLQETGSRRNAFFLGTGILFLADLATFSRGGYVGLLGMGVFFLAFMGMRLQREVAMLLIKRAFLSLIVIGAFVSLVAPVRERLMATLSLDEGSNAARIALWKNAGEHIAAHPWRGYGLGNYPLVVKPSADYREPIYIHNTYLDVWAELGLIGLLSFLFLTLAPLLRFFLFGSMTSPAFPAALALALFLSHSVFENVLFSVHVFPALLFLLAMLSWYKKKENV